MAVNPAASTPAPSRPVFASLQAGRAIAALLVVLFHNSTAIFNLPKYWGKDPLHHLFDFGHAGVEFFFVLSGFIILHAHRRDIGRPDRFLPYLKRRFIRIYPLFWLVLLGLLPVYFLMPSLGKGYETDPYVIVSSLLLVHINTGDSITVSWTLYHEVLFYGVFALLLLNRFWGGVALALWFVGSAWMLNVPFSSVHNEFLRSPLDFYLSPLHLLFAMGMAGSWLQYHRKVRAPGWLAIAGLILFVGMGMEQNYRHEVSVNLSNLIYGVASVMMLAGCIELELKGKLVVPHVVKALGDASYSIYLVHFPLLSLLAKAWFAAGLAQALPEMVSYWLIAGLAVVGGVAMHYLFERPIMRWGNAWMKRSDAQRAH